LVEQELLLVLIYNFRSTKFLAFVKGINAILNGKLVIIALRRIAPYADASFLLNGDFLKLKLLLRIMVFVVNR